MKRSQLKALIREVIEESARKSELPGFVFVNLDTGKWDDIGLDLDKGKEQMRKGIRGGIYMKFVPSSLGTLE